jgi:hypothetical protein
MPGPYVKHIAGRIGLCGAARAPGAAPPPPKRASALSFKRRIISVDSPSEGDSCCGRNAAFGGVMEAVGLLVRRRRRLGGRAPRGAPPGPPRARVAVPISDQPSLTGALTGAGEGARILRRG